MLLRRELLGGGPSAARGTDGVARRPLRSLGVAGALATLVLAAPSALASTVPARDCGPFKTDSSVDGTNGSIPSAASAVRPRPQNLEITELFLRHQPVDGASATTVNVRIADLTRTLPLSATALVWTVQWDGPNGTKFVRAVIDYTGALVFEHGVLVPPTSTPVGAVLPRYEFRGRTTGTLFEGKDGVVQIVVPQDVDGRAGTHLTGIYAQASEGRTVVPNALETPTRGLSFPTDRAPDEGQSLKWQPVADSTCRTA